MRTRGEEPAGRAAARPRQLRLVHAARRRALVAPRADRRRDLLPAQDHQRDAVDVPSAGDDAEVHAGGVFGRRRRPADPVGERRARDRRSPSRTFEVDQKTQGDLPMVYAPQTQSGNFFNRQERNVRSLQFVEALTYLEGSLARPARVQGRRRPAALRLRRRQLQPRGRRRAARRLARRAHDLLAGADASGGQRHRVRGVRAGSLARQRSPRCSSSGMRVGSRRRRRAA